MKGSDNKLNIKSKEYYQTKKKFSWKDIKNNIPPALKPTALTAYIFLVLFVVSILISAFSFDFEGVLAGGGSKGVEVGWPFNILELSVEDSSGFPINIWGLLLDFLIFFAIAYPINVAWNAFVLKLKEKKKKKYPLQIYKKEGNLKKKVGEVGKSGGKVGKRIVVVGKKV